MEMTYDYFKQLVAFVNANSYKTYDVAFCPFIVEKTMALYPKEGHNSVLTFWAKDGTHISRSTPSFTFQDVIELYENVARMLDESFNPLSSNFLFHKRINGNSWILFSDHIEIWKTEQVNIQEEVLDKKRGKRFYITTPTDRW